MARKLTLLSLAVAGTLSACAALQILDDTAHAGKRSAPPARQCVEYIKARPHRESALVKLLAPGAACASNGTALQQRCLTLCGGLLHGGRRSPSAALLQEEAVAASIALAVARVRQQEKLVALAATTTLLPRAGTARSANHFPGPLAAQCRRYLAEMSTPAAEFQAAFGSTSPCWTGEPETARQCDARCGGMWKTQELITSYLGRPSS